MFQLDVDNSAGQAYVDEHGLPACPTIKTGKGYRYVFAHPGEKIKSRSRIVPGRKDIGLDVQAYGANTVLPPSVHYSGVRYQWVDGRKLSDFPDGPPEAPEWVLDLVYQRKKDERPEADPPPPTVAAPRQKEVDLPTRGEPIYGPATRQKCEIEPDCSRGNGQTVLGSRTSIGKVQIGKKQSELEATLAYR